MPHSELTRRSALKGAMGVAALSAAPVGLAHAAPGPGLDVIVVGAGLSGLAAARKLVRAGKRVVVLEARDRPGGRVHNITSVNGRTLDGGAEFVGPTQDAILALLREQRVRLHNTYNDGNSVYYERGRKIYMPAQVPVPPVPGSLEVGAAIAKIDLMCRDFPVGRPWRHPQAKALDAMTWQQWINANASSYTAKSLLALAESSVLSVRPHEVSALFMLNYFAAAGNENHPGSFLRLLSSSGGAQEKYAEGGMALVPLRLARELGDRMVYNAPVRAIAHDGAGVTVSSAAGVFRARKVIVAMSPAITGRIQFSPELPAARRQLSAGMKMGRIAKFAAVYPTPFWRTNGLSGQVIGDGTPVDVMFETNAEGNHVLLGFVSADAMAQLEDVPDATFAARCIDSFAAYFGPQARRFIDYGIKRWDNDPYSWGGPTATTRPGILTAYGSALRDPVGNIHWAGTETSDFWTGYMDGAVRSGYRAAAEVIR